MAYTQANRRIAVSTPLGDDLLLLRAFSGTESMSRLFHFDLDLLSKNDAISMRDMVGKKADIRLFDKEGNERYWNGYISRFSQGAQDKRFTYYHAEVVPWLWFLTRTADCRIFQNQTVPKIIETIFKDLHFMDFEFRLYGEFAPRDYCVQYRETDFNFVSRLMEEEGIGYYFTQSKGKHTLVLANDPASHDPCPGQKTAQYDFRGGNSPFDDVITEWRYEEEFRPGGWTHTDYNFLTPSTNLAVSVKGANAYEIYDYPGEYSGRSDGDRLARIRLQEQGARGAVHQGVGGCRWFSAGSQFALEDHYRADLNQTYLLLSVRHSATQGSDYEAGGSSASDEEFTYRNTFECMPFAVPYRPERITARPVVHGCQTAVVVGKSGEEIYTDEHGQVKVQFHWDREGKKNENSSCWVRVSHPWAGQGWGALAIPRIGQEVVVDFLEGDPDQPIIIGRVYNAEQTPPFGLPGGAMISGYKSNSTKGGGGYNEISLNDTKGTELINVHAQYDQQKKVEHDERVDVGNDRTEHVGHDETIVVDHDRTEEVKHDETIVIGDDKTELVKRDRKLTVNRDKYEMVDRNKDVHVVRNHNEKIDGSMYVTVGSSLTETVAANYAETVGAAMEVTVGAAMAMTVGAVMAITVGGAKTESVGAVRSTNVGGNNSLNVGGNANERIAKDKVVRVTKDYRENVGGLRKSIITKEYTLKAKKIQLTADDEIVIKTGSAQIVMKKNGDISIKGAKINIKGSGDVIVKGSEIKEN